MNKSHTNVIFVLTDDQGYGDLGCTGNPWIQTPHIDQFYNESTHFTNFHVGPTCAPTRSTLMTGHYANSTGVWHTVGGRSLLRKNEVTIADAFKKGGYKTGIFGKWHLGDNEPYRPQDRGFDEVIVHGGGGISQTPDFWGNDYFDDTYMVNGEAKAFEGYCTDVWFDQGIEFIKQNKDEPFFCYIPCNAPHSPYNIMKEYRDLYAGKLDGVNADNRERFYGMISHLDERFGTLRETLKELELDENTILVFMTDNGTSCGAEFDRDGKLSAGYNANLQGEKNSEYDGGHRVPFFIHWPAGGINTARDIDELTASIDFMPTLLDLCHIDHELDFHGSSLVPLIENDSNWKERTIVTDSQRVPQPIKWRKSAVMTNRWRLINGEELYDMEADRLQEFDVASQHPDIVKSLRDEYDIWWDLVKSDFDNDIPIPLGLNDSEICLTSHDWRGNGGESAWNQGQIRQASIANGHWEVEVAEPGVYHFELCRWPKAGSGKALSEGFEGDDITWNKEDVDPKFTQLYTNGKAINVERGELSIAGEKDVQVVNYGDQSVLFTRKLSAGVKHLKTTLFLDSGESLGAYYCYVKKSS